MTSEPVAKKLHTMPKIGTHNGSFHCDEVLACFLLKRLNQYKDAEIIRTRDPSLLATTDIVVDVGGVFDPSIHRYDHHQRTFNESMNSLNPSLPWTTKLSSAGLVYFHFGRTIVAQMLGLSEEDSVTKTIYDKVYENFIQEIDGIDNGIDQFDGEPRYRISTNLSSRVAGLNPKWNEKDVKEMTQFLKAMEMVGAEFTDRINYYKTSWLPARQVVEEAVKGRFDNGQWRIQCVPVSLGSFENRLSIKEEWRGLRDEELVTKSGIPGCVFVHAGGFIGGNKTYDGALEMARACLNTKS
ncbi:UPF0160 protein MYG1, mitochondrial [Elysia marginata]|uniref:UPF0160 protein MYG1, mitochondrial n=1 Tax=Elysia marginata TaxID=1093978 RepID=A0AAV4EJP8_9GAST|nr:UPF0160 protein MYG1, mitochondrial [Elysia marginata]